MSGTVDIGWLWVKPMQVVYTTLVVEELPLWPETPTPTRTLTPTSQLTASATARATPTGTTTRVAGQHQIWLPIAVKGQKL
jgi:hypothetical protein